MRARVASRPAIDDAHPGALWTTFIHAYDGRNALFKSANRARRTHEPWTDALIDTLWPRKRSKAVVRLARRAVLLLCDDETARAVFDSAYRLNGGAGALRVLRELVDGPPATLTPEEREQRRQAGVRKATAARERRARAMLLKHQRALAREERAVARWTRKVAHYDRKGSA